MRIFSETYVSIVLRINCSFVTKAGWRLTKFSLSTAPVFCKTASVLDDLRDVLMFSCCSEVDSTLMNTFEGIDDAIFL